MVGTAGSRRGSRRAGPRARRRSDVLRKCSKKTLGSRARRSRPSHHAAMTADDALPVVGDGPAEGQAGAAHRTSLRPTAVDARTVQVGHPLELADGRGAPVELLQPGAVLRREPELELVEVVHEVRLAEVVHAAPRRRPWPRRAARARVARREQRGADGGGRLRPRLHEVAPRGADGVHHRQAGDALPLGAEVEVVRVRLDAQQVQRLVADEQQRVEVLEHLGERALGAARTRARCPTRGRAP